MSQALSFGEITQNEAWFHVLPHLIAAVGMAADGAEYGDGVEVVAPV